MRILILAAGYGTRLYPLTLHTPKPLLKIKEKPIINFIVDRLRILERKYNIKMYLVCNNRFYQDFLFWRNSMKIQVEIINDGTNSVENRLGAMGDIELVLKKKKDDDWLVIAGDNLFNWSLERFIKYSLNRRPYPVVGLYDIGDKNKAYMFGVVKVNSKKQLIEFEEKPHVPTSSLIATCIYFFPRESIPLLKKIIHKHNCDAAGMLIERLMTKTKVYGYVFKGDWIDIGHKDSLKLAEKKFGGEK